MLYNNLDVNASGNLTVGGVDTVMLAKKYGTPLYVIDEDVVRSNCRSFVSAFEKIYNGNGRVHYASKALCCTALCKVIAEEGMGLDVVSGGELYTALKAGFPAQRIHFHGNNKTDEEIEFAMNSNIESIVADNLIELDRLNEIAGRLGKKQTILMRITPGIDAHTHDFVKTGVDDSKFGFTLSNVEAFNAVKKAVSCENLHLRGLHCHIASQVCEVKPFEYAVQVMLGFIGRIKNELGYEIDELNLGGGYGVKYLESDGFIPYNEYIEAVADSVKSYCSENGIKIPCISIEPGRSIIAAAGITLYTVGNIKEIPGIRNYISVDGGMGDNPRFILYSSPYTFMIANRAGEPADYRAAISGRFCESGDLLAKDIMIQKPQFGDILVTLTTGAYNYSMASNYNRVPRPAVVFVAGGQDRLVVRRETFEDMISHDIL